MTDVPVIDSFKDEFAFLSNFYPCEVIFEGRAYKSVEHAFQAAKTLDEFERKQVRFAPTAGGAKRIGRTVTLRPDWEDVKLEIMESLVEQKFANDYDLAVRLDLTYPAILIEGNWWGDTFWGVCEGKGENHLGKILMKVRSQIQ